MGILPSFRLHGLPRHPCGRLWHGHVVMRRSISHHLRRHSHGDWNLVVLVLRRSYHSCVPEGATAHVRVGVESKLSDPGRVGCERVVWFCTLQPPSLPPHRSRWNIPSMCSPRPAMRLVRTRTPSLSCFLIGPRRGEVGRGGGYQADEHSWWIFAGKDEDAIITHVLLTPSPRRSEPK